MKRILILFVLFSLFLITVFSCKVDDLSKLKSNKYNLPDITLRNYKHYIYKNQKKYLYAKIDIAEFFEKTLEINFYKINAEIYNSNGELTAKVNSDNGIIDKNEKILTFKDNVNIEIVENDAKLHCEELKLDYQNNKLISEKPILLEKNDGSYIQADSMESDLKMESTKFVNMKIKYYYEEEEKK